MRGTLWGIEADKGLLIIPTFPPPSTICGKFGSMLGGYNVLGNNAYISKTYGPLPPHRGLRISLTFYFVDSWDANEEGFIQVDGKCVLGEGGKERRPKHHVWTTQSRPFPPGKCGARCPRATSPRSAAAGGARRLRTLSLTSRTTLVAPSTCASAPRSARRPPTRALRLTTSASSPCLFKEVSFLLFLMVP